MVGEIPSLLTKPPSLEVPDNLDLNNSIQMPNIPQGLAPLPSDAFEEVEPLDTAILEAVDLGENSEDNFNSDLNNLKVEESSKDDTIEKDGWIYKRFVPAPTTKVKRDPLGYRLPKPDYYGERNPYRYDDSQVYEPNNPYQVPNDSNHELDKDDETKEKEYIEFENYNFIPTDIWVQGNTNDYRAEEE
jgi:hypothetical protein